MSPTYRVRRGGGVRKARNPSHVWIGYEVCQTIRTFGLSIRAEGGCEGEPGDICTGPIHGCHGFAIHEVGESSVEYYKHKNVYRIMYLTRTGTYNYRVLLKLSLEAFIAFSRRSAPAPASASHAATAAPRPATPARPGGAASLGCPAARHT